MKAGSRGKIRADPLRPLALDQDAAIGPHGAEVDDLALLVHVLQVERGSPVTGFVLGGKRKVSTTSKNDSQPEKHAEPADGR